MIIKDVIEETGIPFVVSWGAFDICETDHKLRVGSHGVYGDRCANYAIQNADLLIIMGSRLDSRQTGGNGSLFSKSSKKIMIDVDINEITKLPERNINIDYSIRTDLKEFFLNVQNSPITVQFEKWINTLDKWKFAYGEEVTRKGDSEVYDYLSHFFKNIPDNAIVIPDQGGNLVWTMQSAKIKIETGYLANLVKDFFIEDISLPLSSGLRFIFSSEYLLRNGISNAHQASPITGTQINTSFIKNLSMGIFLLVMDCKIKMSAQDW